MMTTTPVPPRVLRAVGERPKSPGQGWHPDPSSIYHGTRGRLSAGQLPFARAPRADVLSCAAAMQALYGRSDLFANRRA
jgi:hypothetical protein